MKRKEIKLTIIQNFILHAIGDQKEADELNEVASTYVDEDHVDEISFLDDQYDFSKIDWGDLREQKNTVIAMQEHIGPDSLLTENLEGVVSLIDSIQDHAVDVLGYDENVVFNMNDEK